MLAADRRPDHLRRRGRSGRATALHLLLLAPLLAVALLVPAPRPTQAAAEPRLTLTAADLAELRARAAGETPLGRQARSTLRRARSALSALVPVAVPPQGPAASAAHVAHDRLIRAAQDLALAGALFELPELSDGARQILLAYAAAYPSLPVNPTSRTHSRLYWQALDEAVFAIYAVRTFDLLLASDVLRPGERESIERDLLLPLARLLINEDRTVDRDNNWACWGVSAVGLIGLRLDDEDLLQAALAGSRRDGQRGLWWQLDQFFSPEAYYFEGPNYAAYAFQGLAPLVLALQLRSPELAPAAYRDATLVRALTTQVALAYPNGTFPALNDADPAASVAGLAPLAEVVFVATGDGLALALASQPAAPGLTGAGLAVERALERAPAPVLAPPSLSVGDVPTGGLAVLRTDPANGPQAYALLKYGGLGGGHGHYDKLELVVWADGREVLPDYGWVRPRNPTTGALEPYAPENDAWGRQTLAHSTVTVDGQRQSAGRHPNPTNVGQARFFDAGRADLQVMSAAAPRLYPDLEQDRTVLLVDRPNGARYLVDLFRLASPRPRRYDWVLHHLGQLGSASVDLPTADRPLGTEAGAQYLQVLAEGEGSSPLEYAWTDGEARYRLLQAGSADAVLLARSGDERGLLRREPYLIVRQEQRMSGHFASVLDLARSPSAAVGSFRLLGDGPDGTVLEVTAGDETARLAIAGSEPAGRHAVVGPDGQMVTWDGAWAVWLR